MGYSVDDSVSVKIENGLVNAQIQENKTAPYECIIEAKVPTTNGKGFTVTDYASAGKLYNKQSKMAVWIFTE